MSVAHGGGSVMVLGCIPVSGTGKSLTSQQILCRIKEHWEIMLGHLPVKHSSRTFQHRNEFRHTNKSKQVLKLNMRIMGSCKMPSRTYFPQNGTILSWKRLSLSDLYLHILNAN